MEKKSYKLLISKLDFYKKPSDENTRLLLVYENNKIVDMHIFSLSKHLLSSIHIAKVKNIIKNIEAAFLELEDGELVYYSLQNNKKHIFLNHKNNEEIHEGDDILVQITKDAIKTKQASASANISLQGLYTVLSLLEEGIKFSSKIKDKKYKENFKKLFEEKILKKQHNLGITIRTAAYDKDLNNIELIYNEYEKQAKKLEEIRERAKYLSSPCMLKAGENELFSIIKSYYNDISEIVCAEFDIIDMLKKETMFSALNIRYYDDESFSLDKLYALKTRIDESLSKKVYLQSGAYLVIEQTEALSVIDVNTGKNISAKNLNDSIYKVNVEAAIESARQIKLRNLSGIILIDFINMEDRKRKDKLLEILNKEFESDKLKAKALGFTKLDLVEITRQRKNKSLKEIFYNL